MTTSLAPTTIDDTLPDEIHAPPQPTGPLGFMAKTTPQLRATVEKLQGVLPPEEFAVMIATVRSAFEKYTAKLLQFRPGVDRGRALHEMMDREMGRVSKLPITCGKGCSGCCHYEVEITLDDAAVLKSVVLSGHAIDHERLAVQAARERRSPEWNRFGSKANRCVFLGDDGACGIYEDRPTVCRKHMVTTPAVACTTEGAAVAPVQVLLAEILLSAELSLAGMEFGSLAKLLQRALAESGARPGVVAGLAAKPPLRAGPRLRLED